ncbi:MAG: type II secretion system minor pseudopilin GspI [Magnetococcales bacterium]|nr:type II secretion system minor pseudopilin GspI [Magnetococcales bacterium]
MSGTRIFLKNNPLKKKKVPAFAGMTGDAPRVGMEIPFPPVAAWAPFRGRRGFSLIEVLVALVVLSLVLGGVVKATGAQARNAADLEDRTMAHWVAMNCIVERRLLNFFPNPGTQFGEEQLGWRQWYWRATISDTPEPDIRRIEVAVFQDSARSQTPVAVLNGYLGKP